MSKFRFRTWLMSGLIVAPLALTGCSDEDEMPVVNNNPVNPDIENAFDFKLTKDVKASFKYPSFAIVEVYDENPATNENAKVLFTTITGSNGAFKGLMNVPSAYVGKTVYVKAVGAGCTLLSEATLSADGITVKDNGVSMMASRSVDSVESPYNLQELGILTGGMLAKLPDKENNYNFIKDNVKDDLGLLVHFENTSEVTYEDAELIATFTAEQADNYNTLYYYVVKAGEENPSQREVENAIKRHPDWYKVFGPFSTASNVEARYDANRNIMKSVKLKRQTVSQWFGSESTDTKFKEGDKVYFVLHSTARKGQETGGSYFFTDVRSYAEKQAARFTTPAMAGNNSVFYTFEDMAVTNHYSDDFDYNDFSFIITSNPNKAIIDPDDPQIDIPAYVSIQNETQGTALFEDNYPSQGDYDMNDFIIKYSLRGKMFVKIDKKEDIEKAGENYIPPFYLSEVRYEVTPIWDGAWNGCDFAFTMDFGDKAERKMSSVIYTLEENEYMGELAVEPTSGWLDYGFVYNPDNGQISGGVNLGDQDMSWQDAFDPYIVSATSGYEIHLTKKRPTPSAKLDGLDEYAKRYVNKNDFPYAMSVPTVEYGIVPEKTRIDAYYPTYVNWVKGQGGEDWYLHPINK